MTCLECTNIKTHAGGKEMAKQGFSGCMLRPVYEYRSCDTERECADFKAASAADVAKRKKWAPK